MDLILQNNGNKQTWVISGLTNVSITHRYAEFDNVSLPEDMPNGEYSYALFTPPASAVEYTIKTDLWDTIVHWDDTEVQLRYLRPSTGVLRIGQVVEKNTYQEKENKTYYYKK